MRLTIGQRVVVLKPPWNEHIWGFTGTISATPDTNNNPGAPDRYELTLDKPTPNGSMSVFVWVDEEEVAPLRIGRTSHSVWVRA